MAKPLAIEDILPSKPEFTLNGDTFTLRPPNMMDQVWIKDTFGDSFAKMLPENDWPKVAKFVYHQLCEKGQLAFRARKATIMNDETGESCEKHLSAAEVLLTSIKNLEEMAGIMGAVYRAIAISNPLIEEIVKKKMASQLKELQTKVPPIGEESSTRSKASTGGRSRKSRR